MKLFNKKIFLFSLLALLLGMFGVFQSTLAQTITLQIPFPGMEKITVCDGNGVCNGIAQYVVFVVKFIVGALSMLAVLLIMIGGLVWLTAMGSTQRITQAKKLITDSLYGFIITLGSYTLLTLISPSFVSFSPLNIRGIDPLDFEAASTDLDSAPESYQGFISKDSGSTRSTGGTGQKFTGSGGGGKVILIRRTGREGKKCATTGSTATFRKVYSHPTAAQLENYFKTTRDQRFRTLVGHANQLIQLSNQHNLDIGIAIGIWLRETQLMPWYWNPSFPEKSIGREGAYNIGDMKAPSTKSCEKATAPRCEKRDTTCPKGVCYGPEGKAAGDGRKTIAVCFRCFNSLDEGMTKWFQIIGRYQQGKSIADALETYAPQNDNLDTRNGTYQDLVAENILKVAKSAGDAAYTKAKQDLGCR